MSLPPEAEIAVAPRLYLQVGAFVSQDNAEQLRQRLERANFQQVQVLAAAHDNTAAAPQRPACAPPGCSSAHQAASSSLSREACVQKARSSSSGPWGAARRAHAHRHAAGSGTQAMCWHIHGVCASTNQACRPRTRDASPVKGSGPPLSGPLNMCGPTCHMGLAVPYVQRLTPRQAPPQSLARAAPPGCR